MFNTMFNDYDLTKSYSTVEKLKSALTKIGITTTNALVVQIPHGKNIGRYTAIFPYENGKNTYMIHYGFKVLG